MSARVLVVEHQASCPPALLGEWLAEAEVQLDVRRPWAGDELPGVAPASGYAGLLVLGGEMGANDDDTVAWLPAVKDRIRTAVAHGLPVLGVCLGHQLAAVALGGEVRKNPHGQTVGLTTVGWTREVDGDALVDTPDAAVTASASRGIHWNSDVVTRLPDGAVTLARTPDGYPQVVRYAPAAWGVQLHPEADEHVVQAWAEGDRADHLARGLDQEQVLADIAAARSELEQAWRPLGEAFARLVAAQRKEA